MNCPICRSGVLERVGEVYLDPVKIQDTAFRFDFTSMNSDFTLYLNICSRGDCNYTTFEANNEFLPILKKEKRRLFEESISQI